MSNATSDTRGPGGPGGERRRQRSRGGKGRNRNRNRNNEQGNQSHRGEGGGAKRGDRGPRRPRKEFKPAPLTWWQKLLKAIGLYKEPVRPPRPERKESVRFEEGPPREVKSNTRNARQRDSSPRDSEAPRRRAPERTEVSSARIYLGNLSYDATEEDLKELFKGVGTVRNVEIVYNRRTHRSKGYGFVDMLNTDDAKRSVEILHDQFFMGRKLVVSGAKTKDHEDDSKEEAEEAAAEAQAAAEKSADESTPAAENASADDSSESIKFGDSSH